MSVRFDILSINRIGEESAVPLSALPIGHTRLIQDTQLVEIDPLEEGGVGDLLSRIAALPQIEGTWERKKHEVAQEPAMEPEPALKPENTEPVTSEPNIVVDEVKKEVNGEVKAEEVPVDTVDATADALAPVVPEAPEAVAVPEPAESEYEYPTVDAAKAAEDAEVACSPVLGFVHM